MLETAIAKRVQTPTRPSRRRQALTITHHVALVHQIAARLCLRLPKQVDVDEIVSAGHVGLVEAAAKFDPARGVPFGAFARRRILGAMLDYLREIDPLTRHARRRVSNGLDHHFEVQLHMDDPSHVRAHGLDALVSGEPLPDAILTGVLQSTHVRQAVAQLPTRERYVIEQYFWHQRQLSEIGRDLGVGESRASMLKKQGCARLRRILTC